jgi:hypothetical protein
MPMASEPKPMNILAVLAFVFVFINPAPVGLVLGLIALGQIDRTGERGRGLAITAVVFGVISILVWTIVVLFMLM